MRRAERVASDPRKKERGEEREKRRTCGQFAAHRSPLAARRSLAARAPARPKRAPHVSRAAADNFEEPQAPLTTPPPPPHATMVRTSSPPPHTLPHPAPHETRRATRCRHPENSLTSPYRASRLHRCAVTRFRRGSASPRDAWPLTRPHSLYRAARYAPAAPPARMSAAVGRPST